MSKLLPAELEINADEMDLVFKNKGMSETDLNLKSAFYPNQYVILINGNTRAVCRSDKEGNGVRLLHRKSIKASGISPKVGNEEQLMALDALLDDSIPMVALTGRAGTGKTLLTLAAAVQRFGKYDGIILIKPMSQVGKYDLGTLPGTIEERYSPYLSNYFCNLELVSGDPDRTVEECNIQFMPLQLIRGASWRNKYVIVDEVQCLTRHDILTIGTRIGEGSKLVLMGDMRQRDEKIEVSDTGLYKLQNDDRFSESALTASVELIRVERSGLTGLFADILEED